MSSILGREGADPRKSKNFYKAVVQTILLFGAEYWVMYPRIGMTLTGSSIGWPSGCQKFSHQWEGKAGISI